MPVDSSNPVDQPGLERIAAQNDVFREHVCLCKHNDQIVPGRLVIARSIVEAEDGFLLEAVKATGEYDIFESENDPRGWHDFGAVDIRGEKIFWKIDLYEADSDFRYGAEAPDNPATTMRVLTIMMASDW